jgi:hypothetical protein
MFILAVRNPNSTTVVGGRSVELRPLAFAFIHESVNHSEKEYARGAISTTTIDGFWNLFKRSYRGTYTHLSPGHLDRYVKEHTYRWNRWIVRRIPTRP